MNANRGLSRRLSRDFLLQAVYISVAALVGVFAAAALFEDVLTKQALRGEADYLWQRLSRDPNLSLPETRNMLAYLEGKSSVPEAYVGLDSGFHRVKQPDAQLVYVTERMGRHLYLIFQSRQVNDLVLAFGLLPLSIVLIAIYLALFSAYRVSRRAVSPIITLASRVQDLDPSDPDPNLFSHKDGNDDEIAALYQALGQLAERLALFSEREQNFTRDASHELRSPLTVVRMAASALNDSEELSKTGAKNLGRIRQAARDMEELTEAFLLLARESVHKLRDEWVSVSEIASVEVEKARLLIGAKPVQLATDFREPLQVAAPEKVVASIVGNLLRNAVTYTSSGEVRISIDGSRLTIVDTGPGMTQADLDRLFQPFFRANPGDRQRGGHGVGLTIVKRLTDRFKWPLDVQSQRGVGTTVTVDFDDARIEGRETLIT